LASHAAFADLQLTHANLVLLRVGFTRASVCIVKELKTKHPTKPINQPTTNKLNQPKEQCMNEETRGGRKQEGRAEEEKEERCC